MGAAKVALITMQSRIKTRKTTMPHWYGNLDKRDDFGVLYGHTMYDGKTKHGPWANMTEKSWRLHGCGKLGTGFGQKYEKQSDGRWLKVEG